MNRPFGVPALAGPDRLKAGLQTGAYPFERHRCLSLNFRSESCSELGGKLALDANAMNCNCHAIQMQCNAELKG